MGWLVKYSEERNYCLYSYLAHLDRLAKDPSYKFVFSEVPHLITMLEYEPHRMKELKLAVKQGRVELVNAFVLEPTINLAGGEALVQQGIQGLQWYNQVMDARPRYSWMIDTVGWHEQMAQIVSGLDLDAFVYCRQNPTSLKSDRTHAIHWIQSPDGTRTPALGLGHYYRNFNKAFRTISALTQEQLQTEIRSAQKKAKAFPDETPVLLLGGNIDYSLPFKYENYPAELIEAWNSQPSDLKMRMATLSDYMDVLLPQLRSGKYEIPTITSGSKGYNYSAFWINIPSYKQRYRRSEHRLQSAEAIATIANLKAKQKFPSQQFANSWLLMSLNMDRNLLWGVGVDPTFYDANSWDAHDRFEYIEATYSKANREAFSALTSPDKDNLTLFNPINWTRKDPFEIRLPKGKIPDKGNYQFLEDGKTMLAQVPVHSFSLSSIKLESATISPAAKIPLPETIETTYYSAKIDPKNGALTSLKLKSSGREILAAPANVLLAEAKSNPHYIQHKPKRTRISDSSDFESTINVTQGKLATIVEITSDFHGGGQLKRVIRFYHNSRRIDFRTETENIPPGTIISVQFPLADNITEIRRGIPYGFSHGSWGAGEVNLPGLNKNIIPVIRYSDYTLGSGGGVAILDRGLPARELIGNTPILLLHNVCDVYYNRPVKWMNHIGKQTYEYALVVREQSWDKANIPQTAWEYNCPVVAMPDQSVAKPQTLIETSNNVIVQALRRKGTDTEIRLVECLGKSGKATLKITLPHTAARITNMLGRTIQQLRGGPEYTFDIRPQQIVTLRLAARDSVAPIEALRTFDSVIPPAKQQYMRTSRNPALIGHPPAK